MNRAQNLLSATPLQPRPNLEPLNATSTTNPAMSPELPTSLLLPICLAIIILPPAFAVVVSGGRKLTHRFGETLVAFCKSFGTLIVYLVQVAMVLAALVGIYFSMGAFTFHTHASIPIAVEPVFLAVMNFILVLGFLAMIMFALYLVEWATSSAEAGYPTKLRIWEIVSEYTVIGVQGTVGYMAEQYARFSGMLSGSKTSKGLLKKTTSASEKQDVENEELTDDEAGSEDDETPSRPELPFEIARWK